MTSSEPEMTDARTEAIRVLLTERIRDEPRIHRRRTRKRALLWGGIGVLGATVLTTGAAILLHAAPITDTTIVHCLSSTVPAADGSYPGSAATIADDTGPGRVDDALDLCRQMWQEGILSGPVDPVAPTHSPGSEVPVLQVCVMRDGTAAVVPSESATVCQSLGMAPLAP